MTKKEINRHKIIEYIGDAEHPFPDRRTIALTVCGYKNHETLYKHFAPAELSEIEAEGLKFRREKYAPHLASADRALLKKAAEGDVQAAKLCYQRFEGWSEKTKLDVGVTIGDVLAGLPPEIQKLLKEAMAQKLQRM
ncbi:hypothetical protein JCM14469_26640 [Desulfatiferula olefinivorans]